MKKALFILFLLGFIALVVGTCNAQTKWASKEEAEEFFGLNYNNIENHIYIPKSLKGYKPLSDNEQIVMFSDYATVKMRVVGGTYWVIQEPKTRFVVDKETEKITRLEICGNKITGFKELVAPQTTTVIKTETPTIQENPVVVEKSLALKPETPSVNVNVNVNNELPEGWGKEEVSSSFWPLAIIAAIITAGAVAVAFILSEKKGEKAPTSNPPGVDTGGVFKIAF